MKQKTLNKIRSEDDNKLELVANGFKIQILKPWHWRITKEDYDIELDVWPTAKKTWIVGTYKKARVYTDLYREVTEIFNQHAP